MSGFKAFSHQVLAQHVMLEDHVLVEELGGQDGHKPKPCFTSGAWVDACKGTHAVQVDAYRGTRSDYNRVEMHGSERESEFMSRASWETRDCDTWNLEDALASLDHMVEHPSVDDFIYIMHKCRKRKNAEAAQCLHVHMCSHGLEDHIVLRNHLVPMLAESGNMPQARKIFDRLLHPSLYSWTSLLQGYAELGEFQQASDLFQKMKENCVHLHMYALQALLKACSSTKNIESGQEIHVELAKAGFETDPFVGATLVDMYAKCGSLTEALKVLGSMQTQDAVMWNALISGYADHGLGEEALRCFEEMKLEVSPDAVTFMCSLKSCGSIRYIEGGLGIHAEIIKLGFESNSFIGNALVDMYAKCGSLAEAQDVFDMLPVRDVVSWNALIAAYTDNGLGDEAVDCLMKMQLECVFPNIVTYVCIMKTYAGIGALDKCQIIHGEIVKEGVERHPFVGNSLIDMYAKCGSLAEAKGVFDELPSRDVVSWNALIAGYGEHMFDEEGLNCLVQMHSEGVSPDAVTFVCSLKCCGGLGAIGRGLDIHSMVVKEGFDKNLFVGYTLVDMYARCGWFMEARVMFEKLAVQNVVAWNALITGYAEHGCEEETLECLEQMQLDGVSPNAVTYMCSLKCCSGTKSIGKGQEIHLDIVKEGLEVESFVGNTLVHMYAQCGSLAAAQRVFDNLHVQDAVSWGVLIAGYAEYGFGEEAMICVDQMQEKGLPMNALTLVASLKGCASIGSIGRGREIHIEIAEEGFETAPHVASTLVHMYAKCGSLEEAESVFDELPVRDVVSWGVLMAAYAEHGFDEKALLCLEQIQQEGMPLNTVTVVHSLKACGSIGFVARGQDIHREIVRKGSEGDPFVGSAVMAMYAKCGLLAEAREVLLKLPIRDVIPWNVLIAGFAEHGFNEASLNCLEEMQLEGISPDAVTFVFCLKACGSTEALDRGQELHAEIVKEGFERDQYVGSTLVDMYGKCGLLVEAQKVFDELQAQYVTSWNTAPAENDSSEEALSSLQMFPPECVPRNSVAWNSLQVAEHRVGKEALDCLERKLKGNIAPDVVPWNALMAGYAEHGASEEVLKCLERMQQQDVLADSVTFLCGLKACSNIGASGVGRRLHAEVVIGGFEKDPRVENTLVDVYAKCGLIEEAQEVFDEVRSRNAVSWNALIAGYAFHGESNIVFQLLDKMREEGMPPDKITLLSVLTVCSHGGLMDEGQKYFEAINKEYGIIPTLEHSSCMVDLLGRAGHLEEAMAMMEKMYSQPNVVAWNILLDACRKWGDVAIGKKAFENVVRLGKTHAAPFILMSNLCSINDVKGTENFEMMRMNMQVQPVLSGTLHTCPESTSHF